jgi:uncharacterized protein (TIGR02099 family)
MSSRSKLCLWDRIKRHSMLLVLILLVPLTILMTGTRLLLPHLDISAQQLGLELSRVLKNPVTINRLQVTWSGFSPAVIIGELDINLSDEQSLSIGRLELGVDVSASLLSLSPRLSYLRLDRLQLPLHENAEGEWLIPGLPPPDLSVRQLILQMLLDAPLVQLSAGELRLQRFNGSRFELSSLYLQSSLGGLLNHIHNLNLQFRPGIEAAAFRGLASFEGSLADGFNGQLWMATTGLDLSSLLHQIVEPELFAKIPSDLELDTEVWIDFSPSGVTRVKGQVNDLQANFMISDQPVSLRYVDFTWQAQPNENASWQADVQQLVFDLNNQPFAMPSFSLILTEDESLQFYARQLNLQHLHSLFSELPLPVSLDNTLTTLQPRGNLNKVFLSLDPNKLESGLALRGELQDVAVDAWNKAPSVSGLQGFVEMMMNPDHYSGVVWVDSKKFDLHLPLLFPRPWEYSSVSTKVYWDVKPAELKIWSEPIKVSSQDLNGQLEFGLINSSIGTPDYQTEFNLRVGMDWMNLGIHSDYIPLIPSAASVFDWVDTALDSGLISHSGFILRSVGGTRYDSSHVTHQSFFKVSNATLNFLSDWPTLHAAKTNILISNNEVDLVAENLNLGTLNLKNAKATVRPHDESTMLTLEGAGRAEVNDLLNFLSTTPVHSAIGVDLSTWSARGKGDIQFSLLIPLRSSVEPEELTAHLYLDEVDLKLPPYELEFTGIKGEMKLSNNKLSSNVLNASFLNKPLTAHIVNVDDSLNIQASGMMDVNTLEQWRGLGNFVPQVLKKTGGEFNYRAELRVPDASAEKSPELQLDSDLQGFISAYPLPFTKVAKLKSPLSLTFIFDPDSTQLELSYADFLSGQLLLQDGTVDRGQLYLGKLNESFSIRRADNNARGLFLLGEISQFDFDAWKLALAPLLTSNLEDEKSLSDYLALIDMDIGDLTLFDRHFMGVNTAIEMVDDQWKIKFANTDIAGDLQMPLNDDEGIWKLDLAYLNLPQPEYVDNNSDTPDLLEEVDPRELPSMDIVLKELTVGEHQLGRWSFSIRPEYLQNTRTGVVLNDFLMRELTSNIEGLEGEATGASMHWSFDGKTHNSSFAGVFRTGNLAQVMPNWGYDAVIISRNSQFRSELSWPGSPVNFSLASSTGEIALVIDEGNFTDVESGGVKLLGAFNFDALARRLQLDFSDVYSKGFAYDDIRGQLNFEQGKVVTNVPVVVNGTSSRLTIEGELNMLKETITADMQVRIPVGENISMLAGLLGAWPIAIGTYLASKVFSEKVGEFTTVLYRLDGSWSDPQGDFEYE